MSSRGSNEFMHPSAVLPKLNKMDDDWWDRSGGGYDFPDDAYVGNDFSEAVLEYTRFLDVATRPVTFQTDEDGRLRYPEDFQPDVVQRKLALPLFRPSAREESSQAASTYFVVPNDQDVLTLWLTVPFR